MTPHHLHALAAAWSLQAALAALQTAAMEAVADALAGDTGHRDVSIPSQQFGRRHALGGHGDPTADLALGAWAPGRPDPDAALLGDMLRQLDHMAGHLPGAPGMDPLTRIRHAIPGMRDHVAARTAEALAHLDATARKRVFLPPNRYPMPGAPPCPACRARSLHVQTAGPEDAWTVVCAGTREPGGGPHRPCVCTGPGCPCDMPGAVEGVAHIWRRDHVLRAVAGAAPTT